MHVRGWSLLVAGVVLLGGGDAVAIEQLRIGGTGNALGTMKLLATEFGKRNTDVQVTVLPSLGTSGAMKALPAGAIEIGLSARPLNAQEIGLGLVAIEYARTPLVFAVSTKSRASALTLDQAAAIYDGKLAVWPDGSAVRPVLRQAGDDNTQQVRRMSPALDAALSVAEKLPGLPFATNDQEAADKMESIPGALGVTTLALINSEGRSLRGLTIDGVEPTPANGASGKYPHVKRFYLVTRSDPPATVRRFTAFLHSPVGHEILARAGHWTP